MSNSLISFFGRLLDLQQGSGNKQCCVHPLYVTQRSVNRSPDHVCFDSFGTDSVRNGELALSRTNQAGIFFSHVKETD